jgi:tRNA threonylcarbamoyl adenosine modification protein YeaZ
MLILAAEQSTRNSSAVVSSDSEVLASVTWEESRIRSQQFFGKIETVLGMCGRTIEDIDLFAAGVGPGAFNALRMCLSAMKAFSLPDAKPVYGVSSAQALALQLTTQTKHKTVSIVGDARRGHLWLATATITDAPIPERYELTVIKPEKLSDSVIDSDLIASPDFDRIPDVLASIPNSSERLYSGSVSPHARFVAETAYAAVKAGLEGSPLTPIYIHPPV